MKKQNYQNHIRFYAPHHFILLPLIGFALFYGIYQIFKDSENQLIWILFSVLSFFMMYLTLILRQHYALGNQNRIVRLEFRLRYFELFGKRSDLVEKQLTFSQIAALRFADDQEFISLLDKTLKENTSADAIKKSIKNWQADNMRV